MRSRKVTVYLNDSELKQLDYLQDRLCLRTTSEVLRVALKRLYREEKDRDSNHKIL